MPKLLQLDHLRALLLEGDVVLQQLYGICLLLQDPSLLGLRQLYQQLFLLLLFPFIFVLLFILVLV